MKYSIPYSNHGSSPIHIEDILLLLKHSIESISGNYVNLSRTIDYNSCNIILENFGSNDFLKSLIESRADYIIVATEFITNKTFNCFSNNSDYGKHSIWKTRYNNFIEAAKYARAIWCFYEDLIDDYRNIVGEKILFFPMTYVPKLKQFETRPFLFKDIDVIFTGGVTAYRKNIFDELTAAGLEIFTMPSNTPTYIRNDFSSRAKIGINLRQSRDWKYASLMRYHYHIMNKVPMIGEKCEIASYLDKYVIIADRSTFVSKCIEMIENKNVCAESLYSNFEAEMQCSNFIPQLIDKTMSFQITKCKDLSFSTRIKWQGNVHEDELVDEFHIITEEFNIVLWTFLAIRKFARKFLQLFHLKK